VQRLGPPQHRGQRLHGDARRFLATHRDALSSRPVAFFALGPVNDVEKEWEGARRQLKKQLTKFPWFAPISTEVFGGKYDPMKLGFPFNLIPAVSASLRDGRPANLPWLQESPDPLTSVVWDSCAELHPSTAKAMEISEGDVLLISSAHGSIRVKAYLMPGIHPGSVAVAIGQGHESYGRFATNIGVNPLKILDPIFDRDTGELALYATRVSISKTGQHERMIKDEGPTTLQQGRKLVATLAADQVDLTKETPFVIR